MLGVGRWDPPFYPRCVAVFVLDDQSKNYVSRILVIALVRLVALRTAEVIDIEDDLGVVTAGMDLSDEDSVELRVGVASEGGTVVFKTKGNLFHIGCK